MTTSLVKNATQMMMSRKAYKHEQVINRLVLKIEKNVKNILFKGR